ncbi:MAG TPA: aspartyl protease family protein [Candidatus Baltobacteraceae bacterium]|jgi:hypothetical protein|nr:aspartyl protease family protein [Candidatus Baltobacteraceae bacterium]
MIGRAAAFVALAFFALPAAAAPEYAPAPLSVSQLFERNRHELGSLAPGTYRMVSREELIGGDTRTVETYTDGRSFRTTVRIGTSTSSYGADQEQPWTQDANGLVTRTTGVFAETDPFLASMRNAQNPSSGVRMLGLSAETPSYLVVEVTPDNGLVERRYYDPTTYLLTRLDQTDYDGHKRSWEYNDYRVIAGRRVAFSIAYTRDGSPVSHTTVASYQRVTSVPGGFAIPASRALFDLGNQEAVAVPAKFTDDGIIVSVSIAGRGLDFLLDSGASALLIDPEIARQLGMGLTGAERVSFGGDFVLANAQAPDFTVGALTAKDVAFSTATFQEELPNQRVVGLLGTDFIASGALEVDYQKKTLTLVRSVPNDLESKGWSPLPLRLDYGVPLIKASYSGLPGLFVADLGAVYSTLYPHYFSRFPNLIPRGTADQDELEFIGGRPFGVKHITMKSLVLGDWAFGGVQVVVPSAQYAQERDYDGLIGRDTLSNFNMIFDYANARLWFKPIDQSAH